MPFATTKVAIICNAPTPYRIHLHQRIVREATEIKLWSLFTQEVSNSDWDLNIPDEIRPVMFGRGELSAEQGHLDGQWQEWKKGGLIVEWLRANSIDAVVLFGYNDAARVRIIEGCRKNSVCCFLFGDSNVLLDRPPLVKRAIKRILVGYLVRRVSGVLYCGRLGCEYFLRYGSSANALWPFPYEPDYGAIERISLPDVEKIQREFKLPTGRRRLLFCGRLAREKRVDLLIKAFSAIANKRPEWDLVVAGDGPLREELGNAVPGTLKSRVVWTGFINEHAKLAALYRCADILVLPSDYEPWGVVVTEAAVCLAIVCSSVVGAAADLIREGVNGMTFRAGDAESLTAALLNVTAEHNIDRMRAASPQILKEWRSLHDPVANLRLALAATQC